MPEPVSTATGLIGAATKALDAFAGATSAFTEFTKALGKPVLTLADTLDQELQARKMTRLVTLASEVSLAWRRAGVTPKALPDTFRAAYYEASLLEDDPDLQAQWIGLLVNAADPGQDVGHAVAFVNILKQLTPVEAKLLSWLFDLPAEATVGRRDFLLERGLTDEQAEMFRGAPDRDVITAAFPELAGGSRLAETAINLERLGLVTAGSHVSPTLAGQSWTQGRVFDNYVSLTPFGHEFLYCCRVKKPAGPTAL